MRDTERMAPARTLIQERRFRDRGQTKIFHGRGAHTRFVGNVLTSVTRLNEPGAAILFQGPPSAGKTTLLAHIAAQTHDAGWRVVYLKPRDLESPARMAQVLGGDYVEITDRHLNTDAVLAKSRCHSSDFRDTDGNWGHRRVARGNCTPRPPQNRT